MQHKTIVHHDEIQDILHDLKYTDSQIAHIMFSLGYDIGEITVETDDGETIDVAAWVHNGGLFSLEDQHPDNTMRSYNRWQRDIYRYAAKYHG